MTDANFMTTSPMEQKIILDYRKKLKKGKLLKCPRCGHQWIYGGQKKEGYTSCPKCLYGSVNLKKHAVIEG